MTNQIVKKGGFKEQPTKSQIPKSPIRKSIKGDLTPPQYKDIDIIKSEQRKNKDLLETQNQKNIEHLISLDDRNKNKQILKSKQSENKINFQANKRFTFLSNSLYNSDGKDENGIKITAENPPEYITYYMLLLEIGVFLDPKLDPKIIDEPKNNTKEMEEIKKKWWRAWYKIIMGNNSYSEVSNDSIKGGGFKNLFKNVADKMTGKKSSAPPQQLVAPPRPITAPPRPITAPPQQLVAPQATLSLSLSPPQSAAPPRSKTVTSQSKTLPQTEEEKIASDAIENKLLEVEKRYLFQANKTNTDAYGYNQHDYEEYYFDFAKSEGKKITFKAWEKKISLDTKLIAKTLFVNKIVCDYNPSLNIQYPDSLSFNTMFQLVKDNDMSYALYMYGMQLPHQFNREILFETFIYLFHLKIYSIVDLQDCKGGTNKQHYDMANGIGCNPYDRDCEEVVYEKAKELTLEQTEVRCISGKHLDKLSDDIKDSLVLTLAQLDYLKKGAYYNIPMQDMTAGYMASWEKISEIKDTSKKENSIVIHCLAGKGRTGSVMLYLILRDFCKIFKDENKNSENEIELKNRLAKPHFGYNDIIELINGLTTYFTLNGNTYNTEAVISEVFKLSCDIIDSKTKDLLKQHGVKNKTIESIIKHGLDETTEGKLLNENKIDQSTIDKIKTLELKSQAIASLLRQRLNRIFFFLARVFDVKEFYTYMRPTTQVLNLPYDEFSNPIKHTITDWKNFDKNVVFNWVN